MMRKNVIRLDNGLKYIYSDILRMFTFLPSIFDSDKDDINCENKIIENYFNSGGKVINFQTEFTSESIKFNLANLRQLLIEVTDACNLECKYCAYGSLYNNYDERKSTVQQYENVKLLIDTLVDLWKSKYNISYNKEIYVGFYGGEPLLNMSLICEVVENLNSMKDLDVHFSYNMTTNGVLLNKYIDFLVDNKFALNISLDGNEYNSSYRVDKHGVSSFSKVFNNIKLLQRNYPDYFDKNVNFNAVLHDRNSIEDIFTFVKKEFDKTPRVAELNVNGLSETGKKEMKHMFNSRYDSFDKASDDFKIQDHSHYETSSFMFYHSFISNFCGNYFNSYMDLFDSESSIYIPTGTCRPFERKIFLTVNGKILPCEKMGQKHALGMLNDGILRLDYKEVGKYYKNMYEKVIINCRTCFYKNHVDNVCFYWRKKTEN